MKKSVVLLVIVCLVGCSGPSEQVSETKPSEVHQNISKAQQDQVAASLKNWTPDKKK